MEMRFIPAPAGDTRANKVTGDGDAVHPRACGGHYYTAILITVSLGSSPRLRGTRGRTGVPRHGGRFIPAPAGDTKNRSDLTKRQAVHPRACGGHVVRRRRVDRTLGSSPRLRGTQSSPRSNCARDRFIPAPAGDTIMFGPIISSSTVHPRACGGHIAAMKIDVSGCGSSPRLRGTRRRNGAAHRRRRFIPAPAGDTQHPPRHSRPCAVHPRACGGHAVRDDASDGDGGSSPRLRGTLAADEIRPVGVRFIPAPAGDTIGPIVRRRSSAVHPRACGGHRS